MDQVARPVPEAHLRYVLRFRLRISLGPDSGVLRDQNLHHTRPCSQLHEATERDPVRLQGFGFRMLSIEFRVSCSGFRKSENQATRSVPAFRVPVLTSRVSDLEEASVTSSFHVDRFLFLAA